MSSVPLTYLYDFEYTDDKTRPYVMHEFAVNGAKHLVLSDTLLKQIFARPALQYMLLEEMAAEGLSFLDSHAIFGKFLDMNCPVKEARPQMILRHKLQLQLIAEMGVDTITIHHGNENVYPEYTLEQQIDCTCNSLEELLPDAERLGITICIENIWSRINTPESLLKIKSRFPTDALGFCYDSGHANLMDKGRNFPESNPFKAWKNTTPEWEDHALEKMLPHVVNCHLHDNDGTTDQHRNIGNGTVNWDHIAPLLKTAPRLKLFQSEVIPVRSGSAIREICEAFKIFR